MADELRILQNECLLWIEPYCRDFDDIVLGPPLRLFVSKAPIFLEESLIISHLNVDVDVGLVLKPLREVEAENVADVHRTARSSAGVKEESLALVIIVQY